MKYTEIALNTMRSALKTNWFYIGEAVKLFLFKYPENFEFKPQNAIDIGELSPALEFRFAYSLIYPKGNEFFVFDNEPEYIVPLTREMKIALIKCIAADGYMPAKDFEVLAGATMSKFDILSSREIAQKNIQTLSEFLQE